MARSKQAPAKINALASVNFTTFGGSILTLLLQYEETGDISIFEDVTPCDKILQDCIDRHQLEIGGSLEESQAECMDPDKPSLSKDYYDCLEAQVAPVSGDV